MSKNNVIDLDPTKRLSKEALKLFKDVVAEIDFNETDSVLLIRIPKDKKNDLLIQAYGMTFETIGYSQTVLSTIGQTMLQEEMLGGLIDPEDFFEE